MLYERERLRKPPFWERRVTVPFSLKTEDLDTFSLFVTDFRRKEVVSNPSFFINNVTANRLPILNPDSLRKTGASFECAGNFIVGPISKPGDVVFLVSECDLKRQVQIVSTETTVDGEKEEALFEMAWTFNRGQGEALLSIHAALYNQPSFILGLGLAAKLFLPSESGFVRQAFQVALKITKNFEEEKKLARKN